MNRDKWMLVVKLGGVLACLYCFIVGIGAMGESFKLFGKEFSDGILRSTSSPVVGLFVGLLATAIVQSSSTTTSIIVGMVAGGAISIEGAVPMVMGANIGTTITNLMVSLGHITRSQEFKRAFAAATIHDFFNLITVAVLFPLELLTGFLGRSARILAELFSDAGGMKLANPLKAVTKPAIQLIQDLVFSHPWWMLISSLLLTFATLYFIVKLLRSLVLERVESFFDEHLFKNAARAMVFGMFLTVAVQSSSITTSLVIPLAGAGILRLAQIFPYTLGANVGTTVTACLAALATNNQAAVTVAFAHLLFNLVGIAMVWPVPRIRALPVRLSERLSDLALRNRLIPIVFIALVFFVVPAVLIFLLNP